MNYEFLKRLFTSCSEETGNGYRDGLNLSELYEQMDEVITATQHWGETMDKAALAPDVADDLGSAAFELVRAYELQSFINGFRLCAQLGRELGTTEGDSASPDKYMTPMQRLEGLASPRQIRFLEARGFQHPETWSFEDAKSMIDQIAANGWRVPQGISPAEYQPEGRGGQRYEISIEAL